MERRRTIMSAVVMLCLFSISSYGMYCPQTGRFLQRDPIGTVDSLNLYQYVLSNPVIAVDPSGLLRIVGNPIMGPGSGIEYDPISGPRPRPPSTDPGDGDDDEGDVQPPYDNWGWPIVPGDAYWPRKEDCKSTDGFWRHCMSACRLRRVIGGPASISAGIGTIISGDLPGMDGWNDDSICDNIGYLVGAILARTPCISCRSLCDTAERTLVPRLCVGDDCPVHPSPPAPPDDDGWNPPFDGGSFR